jgi:hypothetical protein
VSRTATRPLSRKERSAIVVVGLYRRELGIGPSYGWLSRELGISRDEGRRLIWGLHRAGFLISTEEPGSLDVTPDGLRAALRKDRRQ